MIGKKIYKILSAPLKSFLFWSVSRIKIGQKQKTIHIVKMDAIGDFVLFSAILPYFRKIYPGYKIVLICDAVIKDLAQWLNNQQILGIDNLNHFDSLIAIDGKSYNRNFLYYYNTLKKIRMSHPEIVIQPTFSRTEKSDELVLISREALKIGYDGDLCNISKRIKKNNDKKYDRLINGSNFSSEIEKNKQFINELANYKILAMSAPKWIINNGLLNRGKELLKLSGIDLLKSLVVICPGSSNKIKNWDAGNFISLIIKLSQYAPESQFILIGGSREKEVCLKLQKSTGIENLYNICGQIKLSELSEVLSNARLYIGNDTAALHIASAVGISTIGMVGGGHGNRFFPYPAPDQCSQNIAVTNKMDCFNCNWKCIYKIEKGASAPCIRDIKVEDVFNQAIKILDRPANY